MKGFWSFSWITASVKWAAGFFEDQGGTGSSKRIGFFVLLWYWYKIIMADLDGRHLDSTLMMWMMILTLFCIGAITVEFIKNFLQVGKDFKPQVKDPAPADPPIAPQAQ